MVLQSFLSFVFILICASAEAKPATVHAVVPDGMTAPLLIPNKDLENPEGIVADYTRALLKNLKREGTVSVVTRYRIHEYVLSGKIDFLCYAGYAWAQERDKFDWSKTLFTKREVILGPEPMPKHLDDLKGKTIGTMLGYRYPALDPLFSSGLLIREDATSEEANLNKLKNGRIQYVVTDEIFLDHYKVKNSEIERNRQRMPLQAYDVSCSLSRKGSVKVEDLNRAIEKLKSSGELKKIFKKYGANL